METIDSARTIRRNKSELIIMSFVLLVLFVMPVIFTRVGNQISWTHVFKIWLDQCLLIPLFAINHWILVPNFMLKKKPVTYFIVVLTLIFTFSIGYKLTENKVFNSKQNKEQRPENKPAPIPPYAQLLMYSLLIVGVDTGLLFSKKWYENEENKHLLETKNAEIQLDMLRNQVSPHFFMNTLNNIYALIDCDTPKAKVAVMKLSKLMRYMLYENEHGKVKISKEMEFIKSYIDLMKLRYADEVLIQIHCPEELNELEIPPMLFICYIENAFKHGISYQHESFITIQMEKVEGILHFRVTNSKQPESEKNAVGGFGLINNESRLKLLYTDNYTLNITSTDTIFNVLLEIPLS